MKQNTIRNLLLRGALYNGHPHQEDGTPYPSKPVQASIEKTGTESRPPETVKYFPPPLIMTHGLYGCHSRVIKCVRECEKCTESHHYIGRWNPVTHVISATSLDSSFRWNIHAAGCTTKHENSTFTPPFIPPRRAGGSEFGRLFSEE